MFVDFGNVRPWAKDLWPEENKFRFCKEIDIEKLAGVCNWINPVKKLFYYGHYAERVELPMDHRENIKSRNSNKSFLEYIKNDTPTLVGSEE